MKKVGIFRAVKGIAFVLIFCLIFHCTSGVLVNPETNTNLRHFQFVRGFFEEPDNSLDAVFIGPSNVFASWIASVAWEKYDLKIRSLTSSGLGGDSVKTVVQHIQKRQPNALYIVCTNGFLWSSNPAAKHDLSDYWPIDDKPKLVWDFCKEGLIASSDVLEYLFPIVRFHSRWFQLQKEDFHYSFNGLKGENLSGYFLGSKVDVSSDFNLSEKREELDPVAAEALNDFLLYCQGNSIRVLFVEIPWAASEHDKAMCNHVADVISSKGFDVAKLSDFLNDIKLDPMQDFYDIHHTNIHGALKITDYLSQYLLANYDFPENSGGYESWSKAYNKYKEIITPYLTEEELSKLP